MTDAPLARSAAALTVEVEPIGTKLTVLGWVALLIPESTLCIADLPCPGGGAIGVVVDPGKPVRIGDRIPVPVTVTKSAKDSVDVTAKMADGSDQLLTVDRVRTAIEADVTAEPIGP